MGLCSSCRIVIVEEHGYASHDLRHIPQIRTGVVFKCCLTCGVGSAVWRYLMLLGRVILAGGSCIEKNTCRSMK